MPTCSSRGGIVRLGKLKLTLGCARYDRTVPLIDGRVVPEGVDLNYVPLEPEELFWRMAQHSEFDASEFPLCVHDSEGREPRFVAIPFPRPVLPTLLRIRQHQLRMLSPRICVERVGVDYTMTANVWISGFCSTIMACTHGNPMVHRGLDQPGRKQRIATNPSKVVITPMARQRWRHA